ncbi:MAG: NADAR family protein [Alphaproteobacteria bacterium]|nr:NADAR family protein [Alphaproteobacteria bacterium]
MLLDLTKFKKETPPQAIMYFREEYKFLSNMEPCKVTLPAEPEFGLPAFECGSTENAYMAWKSIDPTIRAMLAAMDPKEAKKFTHEDSFVTRPDDSPEGRIAIMTEVNTQKYSDKNPKLREKLLATGDAPLFEGNIWEDKFWGIDLLYGKGGENYLGRILMAVRRDIQMKLKLFQR